MIKRIALTVGLILVLPSILAAQSLRAGTWTGSATGPGDAPMALTYDVRTAGDTISILIHTPDRGDYPVSDAKLAGDTLTFRFQPGPTVQCSLVKQADDSFSGECAAEDGMSAMLVMMPPKQEGSGR